MVYRENAKEPVYKPTWRRRIAGVLTSRRAGEVYGYFSIGAALFLAVFLTGKGCTAAFEAKRERLREIATSECEALGGNLVSFEGAATDTVCRIDKCLVKVNPSSFTRICFEEEEE